MSKATSVITDKFKNTFVCTVGEDTTDIQKALFKMGFRWWGDNRNLHSGKLAYIRVNEDGELWSASEGEGLTHPNDASFLSGIKYKEVFRNDILNAAEEVRKIKRKESKEQKKRAARRKWDRESIRHEGQTNPVSSDVIVAARLRDGGVATKKAGWFDWTVTGHPGDILSYKVLTPNKHRPAPQESVVTLENMFTDVAWDLGKGVAVPVHDMGEFIEVPEPQPDTNPKRQYGVASVPLNMWSPLASAYGSLGLYNGALKYGKANFANTPVEASIYIAAAMRHLSAWACGQEFDPADGVPNLAGVLANIAILLEARAAGMLIDDRLKMAGYLKELEQLKEIVKHLNKLHEGKNPKHYTMEAK